MEGTSQDPSRVVDQLEPRQAMTFLHHRIRHQITDAVVLPPERLILPPVPLQHLRKQPARMLFVGSLNRRSLPGPGSAGRDLLYDHI